MLAALIMVLLSRSDAVFLQHSVELDCSGPDSGYTETTREVIIPLTGRGVRRYGELSVSYRSTWESVTVLEASVRHWRPGRADGVAVLEDRPHISLLPSNRLESTLRELTVTFPGVEVGDTLVLEVQRSIERLPMADFYSYTFIPSAVDSVHGSTLSVLWPSDRPIHIDSDCDIQPDPEYLPEGGTTLYSWTAGPSSGIPNLPFTKGIAEVAGYVTVASHTPLEVSAGLWAVLDGSAASESLSMAEPIIEETGGDPRALSRWIAMEIDYLSGDWGIDPGYSPRHPHETLADMSGVCRDRTALLVWLLRRAGFDPVMLLTSTGRDIHELVGSRSFDHILVSVRLADGEILYLDPTVSSYAGGFTYALGGAGYLPLIHSGSPVMTFPESGPGDDRLRISISASMDPESGALAGSVSVSFEGAAEELFRSMLAGVPPGARDELLETLFGCVSGSGSFDAGDPLDTGNPLSVSGTASWHVRRMETDDGVVLLLPGLREIDLVMSRASAYILPEALADVFVETPYACSLTMDITDLPGEAELSGPLEAGGYSISFRRLEDGTVRMEESIALLPMVPDEDELNDLRSSLAARLSGAARTVVIP